MRLSHHCLLPGLLCAWLAPVTVARADPRVAVLAEARPDYTERKFGDQHPRPETYVFMEGHYFAGTTVDHSIEDTPFRRIAEYLAPELARQQYFPTPDPARADLLIVVHWGTTTPRIRVQEMTGQTSLTTDVPGEAGLHATALQDAMNPGAIPDAPDTNRAPEANDTDLVLSSLVGNLTQGNALTLLGYTDEMRRLAKTAWTTETERTLRYDLENERYFIILQAYDLAAQRDPHASHRPVWTMHLNISSPGNNFFTALDRMSEAAVAYVGRTTGDVKSVRPGTRQGTVIIPPFVILGEARK